MTLAAPQICGGRFHEAINRDRARLRIVRTMALIAS
jgi:hypothetical protein